ncbi:MAG: DUF63 family protein [Methanospirillum sp.]|uniref:DUF63 family protein n=1 Tax=Methanospirillum sp. TaxID=45200 RepID=UPI002373D96B|nr:DUF63 family protein [Methanospirillum sp.]MDD1728019.1 DUF63 family protein [Methanospirillum sp.]
MIREFIYKYYIDPIRYGQPYTLVDTLTYAVILIICVWLIYRWLSRSRIAVDREFVYALIPWVILGGLLRVVEDTGFAGPEWGILLTTPLIFFLIFALAALVLWGLWLFEKWQIITGFKRAFGIAGCIASLVTLTFLLWFGISTTRVDWMVAATILSMAAVSTGVVYGLIRYVFKWEYVSDRLYQLLIFGHMLDASATSYGIDLHTVRYVEQHVVGSALITTTGTAFVMFPLKLLVITPGIWILEQYRRSDESGAESGIWYLIILAMIMVGMAPGIRDMLRMVLYV